MDNNSLRNRVNTYVASNDTSTKNLPAYSDEQIHRKIKETQRQEKIKSQNAELQKIKEEKMKYRKTLNKFTDFNDFILLTIGLAVLSLISSLVYIKINYLIYSIIAIVCSYYIGKRLKPLNKEDNIWQVLLWNLSLSIDDFLEYKLQYEVKDNYIKNVNRITYLFCICVAVFNSNTIIYPLALFALLCSYLIAFACKDTDIIIDKSNLVICSLLFGFVLKGVVHSLIRGVLVLDMFNLGLALAFILLYHLLKEIRLEEPIE